MVHDSLNITTIPEIQLGLTNLKLNRNILKKKIMRDFLLSKPSKMSEMVRIFSAGNSRTYIISMIWMRILSQWK